MHDIERYLLWAAIAVLFAMVLMPRSSNYIGEPSSITKLAEFSALNDDIKKNYNAAVLDAVKAWVSTMNKWWGEMSAADKEQAISNMRLFASGQKANAERARQMNGHDWWLGVTGQATAQTSNATSNTMTTTTISAPMAGTVSGYMMQPMVSGYSVADLIAKANAATRI